MQIVSLSRNHNRAKFDVSDRFKTNHQEFMVTPEAIPIIEKLAWHYDEP